MEDDIAIALEEIDRAVAEAHLHNDQLWLPLAAIATLTRALRGVHAEMRKPVAEDTLRRAMIEGINRHAPLIASQTAARHRVMVASLIVTCLALGAVGGWTMRGASNLVGRFAGGSEQCTPHQDGSQLCWLPVVITKARPLAGH